MNEYLFRVNIGKITLTVILYININLKITDKISFNIFKAKKYILLKIQLNVITYMQIYKRIVKIKIENINMLKILI